MRLKHALVAQMVEQRTENPSVGGSIPPQGTTLGQTRFKHFVAPPLPEKDRKTDFSGPLFGGMLV